MLKTDPVSVAVESPSLTPLVTVIIPAYNYGRFLEQAMESVLSQSVAHVEVILIDDASTDETPLVLQRYTDDDRIKVVRHSENRGHIATFNEGLHLARGEIVMLLSADDYCLASDAFERQLLLFDKDPEVGVVYAGYHLVRDGEVVGTFEPGPADTVQDGLEEFRRLLWGNHIPHSGTMVRRTLQIQLGDYDARLRHTGDWDMWLRAAASSKVGYVAAPLYAYRMHDVNMHHRSMSPSDQARQALLTLSRAFTSLPPGASPDVHGLRGAAERHALLQAPWFDVFNGRRRRAWLGIGYALRRSPRIAATREFASLTAYTTAMTLLGPRPVRPLLTRQRSGEAN